MAHLVPGTLPMGVIGSSSSAGSKHSNPGVPSEAAPEDETSNKLQGQVGWLVECLDCHQASEAASSAFTAPDSSPATSQKISLKLQVQLSPHQPDLSQQARVKPEASTVAKRHTQSNLAAQQQQAARPGPANVVLSHADEAAADLALLLSVPTNEEPAKRTAQPVSSTAASCRADAASIVQNAALPSEQTDSMPCLLAKPSAQQVSASDLAGDVEVDGSIAERHSAQGPQGVAADGAAA